MSEARFLVGDAFERMAEIPDGSIDCIVTSPPFLALRNYLSADHPDKHREIGSEQTPAAFLSTLLALTREWRRILAPHGSLSVELGDSYSGSGGAGGDYNDDGWRAGQNRVDGSARRARASGFGWPQAKSLCGIPALYAWSLAYGRNLLDPADTIEPWRIRNLIAWHRPNPPVGALGDKVRPATTYITMACVSKDRWFDLDAERTTSPPLDTWIIPTQPYRGAHYAAFPIAIPRRLIRLTCPTHVCRVCGQPRRRIVETFRPVKPDDRRRIKFANGERPAPGRQDRAPEVGWKVERLTVGWSDCGHGGDFRRGVVLDPFAGSGTTLAAAAEQGRDSIGIDIDARNLELARGRLGLFLVEDDTRPDSRVVET